MMRLRIPDCDGGDWCALLLLPDGHVPVEAATKGGEIGKYMNNINSLFCHRIYALRCHA